MRLLSRRQTHWCLGSDMPRREILFRSFTTATAPGGGSNPISGTVTKTMSIGSSQSGAFLRALFSMASTRRRPHDQDRRSSRHDQDRHDQDRHDQDRKVFDGAWPQVDGRMLWLNERFAQPTVLLQLYMGGEEAPVWWADFPNLKLVIFRPTASSTAAQRAVHVRRSWNTSVSSSSMVKRWGRT